MSRRSWRAALLGVALVVIGVWGAWVPHRTAALVLSGWDLVEYVKFLPGITAVREVFYVPVWCAGLAFAVLAVQSRASLLSRVVLIALALGLVLAILPPYPHVFDGYRSAEFRWRFALGVSGGLLIIILLAASNLLELSRTKEERTTGACLMLLAVVGAVPAVWGYFSVHGTIEAVYGAPLSWGWGMVVFLTGWFLVGAMGGWLLAHS
jgi:hypothetical protein